MSAGNFSNGSIETATQNLLPILIALHQRLSDDTEGKAKLGDN